MGTFREMSLRTSKALKFFAILLFSFEMLAPAIIGTDEAADSIVSGKSYHNASHSAGYISSLLFEENSGEEEERESKDHKLSHCLADFVLVHAFIELTTAETLHTAWVEPHETDAARPALFTLFHTYLI